MLYSQLEAQKMRAVLNRSSISEVSPGDTVYVDLRFYGAKWYNSLDLPNADTTRYLVLFSYVCWYHKTSQTNIVAQCLLFNKQYPVNHHFVRVYGNMKVSPATAVMVDSDFVCSFLHVLPVVTKLASLYAYARMEKS